MIVFLFKLATLLCFGRILLWVYNYACALFFYKRADLLQRYGSGSWVVVTGGSEGIGLGIAKEFARLGFNIVLISRSAEKLQAAKIELQKVNPLSEVKTLSKDFTLCHTNGFFEDIERELEDFDVSVLVNNVGLGPIKDVFDFTQKEIRDLVVVNACSQVGMTKLFMPKFLKRKQRCAQIDLSSSSTITPSPLLTVYAGTKAINQFMSQGLSTYVPNVDVLCVNPGIVSTTMTEHKTLGNGDVLTRVVSVDDCATGIVNSLTNTSQTFGAKLHNLGLGVAFVLIDLIPKDLRRMLPVLMPKKFSIEEFKKI